MLKLEEILPGETIAGIFSNSTVAVVAVKFFGKDTIALTYRLPDGTLGEELLDRNREPEISLVTTTCPWSFTGDGMRFQLCLEAYRIHLAHLFDPLLAVHTSLVEPLPHQISAVYGEMLKRQPLRFLLADDPGAGKTIMAGLLMRELVMRGDLHRCLVVCPGSLATQWQDELGAKFQLPFEILTNDRVEAARSGNVLSEMPLVIARLDQLSRNEDLQEKLAQTDWDLIICDEAHKMSASFFGGEIRETKRYKLGRLLGDITRNLLLMTATPHNGKEEDFQLFLSLLDRDRFEGRFRDGVHAIDVSDLMRRSIKEDLLKFDGKALFPERIAETVNYSLSDLEQELYDRVTDYVSQEFNRADRLNSGRKGTVGFALTILQRRLASSPEAIYQSLQRRRERLQQRYRDEDLMSKEGELDRDFDEEELGAEELENIEETVVDRATASRTLAELATEIKLLEELEKLARMVRSRSTDRKWEQLSQILQELPEVAGAVSKLVIFTEHRDTLNYLRDKISVLLSIELQAQEAEGKANAKLNSQQARVRADELELRLQKRLDRLDSEKQLSPGVPMVVGGALIIPIGLLASTSPQSSLFARETKRVEMAAMNAVMEIERQLGHHPIDVSANNCGYDIESRDTRTDRLRFIEVKGRIAGADAVTVTKNEILTALNLRDSGSGHSYILALVSVPEEDLGTPTARYLRQPFEKDLDWGVTSQNYDWRKLWERAVAPN